MTWHVFDIAKQFIVCWWINIWIELVCYMIVFIILMVVLWTQV